MTFAPTVDEESFSFPQTVALSSLFDISLQAALSDTEHIWWWGDGLYPVVHRFTPNSMLGNLFW